MWFFKKRDTVNFLCSSESLPVVLVAFQTELDALLEAVDVIASCKLRGVLYYRVEYNGIPFVVSMTGVGVQRARRVIVKILKEVVPKYVLVTGISGAIDADLKEGDIVVPCVWDDLTTGEECAVDANLLNVVTQVEGVQMVEKGGTSAVFVADKNALRNTVSVVDMETCPILYEVHMNGVPAVSVRAISDECGNEGTDASFHYAAKCLAAATCNIVIEL